LQATLIPPALSFRSWALGAILISNSGCEQLACCLPFVAPLQQLTQASPFPGCCCDGVSSLAASKVNC
jgi:hypothetical protein